MDGIQERYINRQIILLMQGIVQLKCKEIYSAVRFIVWGSIYDADI